MSSLALTVLTLTLGMFFILIGQFKVTPKFFPDIYDDMVSELATMHSNSSLSHISPTETRIRT